MVPPLPFAAPELAVLVAFDDDEPLSSLEPQAARPAVAATRASAARALRGVGLMVGAPPRWTSCAAGSWGHLGRKLDGRRVEGEADRAAQRRVVHEARGHDLGREGRGLPDPAPQRR